MSGRTVEATLELTKLRETLRTHRFRSGLRQLTSNWPKLFWRQLPKLKADVFPDSRKTLKESGVQISSSTSRCRMREIGHFEGALESCSSSLKRFRGELAVVDDGIARSLQNSLQQRAALLTVTSKMAPSLWHSPLTPGARVRVVAIYDLQFRVSRSGARAGMLTSLDERMVLSVGAVLSPSLYGAAGIGN